MKVEPQLKWESPTYLGCQDMECPPRTTADMEWSQNQPKGHITHTADGKARTMDISKSFGT